MSNLFDKLSTLVNAHVNDLRDQAPGSPFARRAGKAADEPSDPHATARRLRQRLEKAFEREDLLEAKIKARQQRLRKLNQGVDDMIRNGYEAEARRMQNELNSIVRELEIAESDLSEHRMVSRNLLQELNTLEGLLERTLPPSSRPKGRRQDSRSPIKIPVAGAQTAAKDGESGEKTILDSVSGKLNEARAGLGSLFNEAPKHDKKPRRQRFQRYEIIDEEPDPRAPKKREPKGPDMNDRLSRLSKGDDGD